MQFTIKTNELKALLICAAKNDISYYLNGIHFESTPNGIIAASTDGHRLLCINLPSEQAEGIKALIPRALIEAAVKTIATATETMQTAEKSMQILTAEVPAIEAVVTTATADLTTAEQAVGAAATVVENRRQQLRPQLQVTSAN